MGTYMTAQEVAAGPLQGRRSRQWVLLEAKAGRLPSVRLGPRTILFDPDEVDAWIRSRSVPAKVEAASR